VYRTEKFHKEKHQLKKITRTTDGLFVVEVLLLYYHKRHAYKLQGFGTVVLVYGMAMDRINMTSAVFAVFMETFPTTD